ncbi:MAG: hypothetical protein COA78_06840 [Blastopirellula sp.]|nr:MAG: hypothetical protein COA78_06840 [Blastopirellula sp.]
MTREEYAAKGGALSSYDYWRTMYWATPPWLSDEQVAQMKRLTESREAGAEELDHTVPLRGKTVCGLNVPWNLQVIPKLENSQKSNSYWPGMAMAPVDMFDEFKYEDFQLEPSGAI